MRSRNFSHRIPWPLDAAMKRACEEGKFVSLNACWNGAAIEFVLRKRRRELVRYIANAKPKMQNFLLDAILNFPVDLEGVIEQLKRMNNKR